MGSIAGAGGSLFLRKGLVAAQVALSFLLLFGAGLFVRSLQNLKGTDTGVELDNLVTFQLSPALQRLQRRARGDLQPAARRSPARVGRRQVGRLCRRVDPERRRVGQLDVGRGPQGRRRRGHAGVHERRLAGLLRDHEDSAARGARLHARGRDAARRRPSVAVCIVNKQFADHFFPGKSAVGRHVGQGVGPDTKLNIEIIGVVADALYEGPREGVHRQVFVPNHGNTSVDLLRARARWRRRRSTR